jgi:hypothetical protein
MIVRISGEGQYRLDDEDAARLNALENAVVTVVEGGRGDGFDEAFSAVLDYVRANGTPVGDDEIETSDVIIPPADISFEEAGKDFTGEGLIPD